MSDPIVLTHCGKLGDMLYTLPIASWLWKDSGRRIHWVLPRMFGPFRYISPLLLMQPYTDSVTLVDHQIDNFMTRGQPYRFSPAAYGIKGEFYNLGFRSYPDKFLPAYYAEEHGFGYDGDLTINIGRNGTKSDEVLRTTETRMSFLAPQAEPMPTVEDLLALAQRMARAREVHSWYCGIAVLCWFARIPVTVYRVNAHADKTFYFPEDRDITWRHVE